MKRGDAVVIARQILYGFLGILGIAGGLAAVFRPDVFLPPEAVSGVTRHLIQEQGALFLFVGLMAIWCVRNLSRCRPVHLALIVFFVVFSGVHWAGYVEDGGGLVGAIATAIPAVLLLATIPARRA